MARGPPLAPRLGPLKAILAKLEPSKLAAPLPAGAGPSCGRYRRSGHDGDWENWEIDI